MGNHADTFTGKALPDTLYHYCGVSAFYSIITSKQLWLTNAYFMNDYMEHQWLIDKANRRILEMLESEKKEHIKPLAEKFPLGITPYLTCFSRMPDLLSQWRAYAEDGAGFAVGFSRRAIEDRIAQHTAERLKIALWEVEYRESEQQQVMDGHIQDYLKWIEENGDNDVDRTLRDIRALQTKLAIWYYAAQCKNPGFVEEQEWRIVTLPGVELTRKPTKVKYVGTPSEICFRTAGSRIVPYFLFSFTPDAITEIRLGPKNFARDDTDCLVMLLAKHAYEIDPGQLINSAATYR